MEQKSKYKRAVLLITIPCAVILYILCSFIAWDVRIVEWHWTLRLLFVAGVIFCFGSLTIMRWRIEADKEKEALKNNLGIALSDFQQRLNEELEKRKAEKKESENDNKS